jgi:hypothetical protein
VTAKYTMLPISDRSAEPVVAVGAVGAPEFEAKRRETFLQIMTRAVEEGRQLTILCQSGSFLLLSRPIIVEQESIQCYTKAIDGAEWTTIRFAEMHSFKLS